MSTSLSSLLPPSRYVVVDGKTLGVVMGPDIQVLATTERHIECPGLMPTPMDTKRMQDATIPDFNKFRVMPPPSMRASAPLT